MYICNISRSICISYSNYLFVSSICTILCKLRFKRTFGEQRTYQKTTYTSKKTHAYKIIVFKVVDRSFFFFPQQGKLCELTFSIITFLTRKCLKKVRVIVYYYIIDHARVWITIIKHKSICKVQDGHYRVLTGFTRK